MNTRKVDELVAAAVAAEFEQWGREHPSLASVIDRIRLTERTVESLRNSDAYRQALAAYHRDQNDLNFLSQLAELAGPILRNLLGA